MDSKIFTGVNALRRHLHQFGDQIMTLAYKKIRPFKRINPFDGKPRFALVTVNFSTTHYLKLMLLTLTEQNSLNLLKRIIIVDNDSKDGGLPFLRRLSESIGHIELIENHLFCNHARGLRKGITALNKLESILSPDQRSNLLMICDTDIIFRNKETLSSLSHVFEDKRNVFAGELRHHLYPYPEAQASFFVVRRDCYERADIAPLVNHGAPAYWMQRSLWKANLHLYDFPSNYGGYILHRGRSGVAASKAYDPYNEYATVSDREPHYMGIKNGAMIWEEVERKYADLLEISNEDQLIAYLKERFTL
jgi:hypothetical protein